MILLYVAIVLLSVIGIGLRREADGEQALSIQQCNAIKGISILVVFIRHANQYVIQNGYAYSMLGDNLFLAIDNCIGQLCVVMFLFYSGYGTELSILNKGEAYARQIPKRRCLTTLLNFDIAVVVFLVANLLLARPVALSEFCLSLTGWNSIGNSNWYIFDIILCYFISYVSTRVASKPHIRFLTVLALTLLLISVLYFFKFNQSWWYDTLLAYPAGVFVAMNKDRCLELARKYYWIVLAIALASFVLIMNAGLPHTPSYLMASVLFAILVVLITMRVRVQNPVLAWFGKNLFPVYIYQRLPMMVIATLYPALIASQALVFCIISLVITVLIAFAYRYVKISIG